MSLWFLAAAGFLETVEGDVVHYVYIEARIEQLGECFDIHEIAFDSLIWWADRYGVISAPRAGGDEPRRAIRAQLTPLGV